MVDSEVISIRLQKLREYLSLLRKLGEKPKKDFVSDPFIYGNGERYLQLAIQCLLDIGSHIVAEQKLGAPAEYRDIFRILGKEGILPNDFALSIAPLAGLRNILVHDYVSIDREALYELIEEKLGDFETFAGFIADYL